MSMLSISHHRWQLLSLLVVLHCGATWPSRASAENPAPERAKLAAVLRQLDTIEQLLTYEASTADNQRERYYFDYARLHTDLERVRAGIQAYLSPPRAQPRDSAELLGDYRQPAARSPEAECAP